MADQTYKQDDRYDWLGDSAEALVKYYFACEKFEVYGGGKWTTDVVVFDKEIQKWWKIEVKSTDHPTKKISNKSLEELATKADLLVQVRFFRDRPIRSKLVKLSNEARGENCTIEKQGDIRRFLYGTAIS